MYCLKCRRVTETENIASATSRNGRLMRRGESIIRGKTKSQFIKSDTTGGSFLNTLVNKLPFEMHLPGHNITDPGSNLNKRLNPDGMPKEWSNQSIEFSMQRIMTIYAIQNMMILKLVLWFVIRQCVVS